MPAPTQQIQQQLKPASRMTLSAVVKGKQDKPLKINLYGPEGVGKTQFGASAPSPIFIGAEDGTSQFDVARFPRPESFQDVLDAVKELTLGTHEYLTLVIDTLDWLEPLIWRELCRRESVSNIEEVGGGYQKGYVAALDEWRKLLAALERMQAAKRIHVVLLAHSWVKNFKNPEGADFDRYQMKIHDKAAGIVKEWCDAVLFARQETLVHQEKHKRAKGVATGARIIHTERTAAFDAKNRFSLPAELPLSWEDFEAAVKTGRVAAPADLRSEIQRKAKELGGELEKQILETLAKAGDNAQTLAQINNRVNARLAERAEPDNTAPSAEKAS